MEKKLMNYGFIYLGMEIGLNPCVNISILHFLRTMAINKKTKIGFVHLDMDEIHDSKEWEILMQQLESSFTMEVLEDSSTFIYLMNKKQWGNQDIEMFGWMNYHLHSEGIKLTRTHSERVMINSERTQRIMKGNR